MNGCVFSTARFHLFHRLIDYLHVTCGKRELSMPPGNFLKTVTASNRAGAHGLRARRTEPGAKLVMQSAGHGGAGTDRARQGPLEPLDAQASRGSLGLRAGCPEGPQAEPETKPGHRRRAALAFLRRVIRGPRAPKVRWGVPGSSVPLHRQGESRRWRSDDGYGPSSPLRRTNRPGCVQEAETRLSPAASDTGFATPTRARGREPIGIASWTASWPPSYGST